MHSLTSNAVKVITHKEWYTCNELLIRVGDLLDMESYCQQLLSHISDIINSDSNHIFIYRDNSFQDIQSYTRNVEERAITEYIEYYQFIDEIKDKTFDQSQPVKSTQIMDYNRWKNSEYFNEFLKPHNYYYLCGVDIHYKDKLLATLNFTRGRNCPDFTTKDLGLLELLSIHIGNHLHNIRVFEKQKPMPEKKLLKQVETNEKKFDLTRRECEVTELVCQGMSNQEISRKLSISINTVKKHLNKAFAKSGSNSRSQLILKITDISL